VAQRFFAHASARKKGARKARAFKKGPEGPFFGERSEPPWPATSLAFSLNREKTSGARAGGPRRSGMSPSRAGGPRLSGGTTIKYRPGGSERCPSLISAVARLGQAAEILRRGSRSGPTNPEGRNEATCRAREFKDLRSLIGSGLSFAL